MKSSSSCWIPHWFVQWNSLSLIFFFFCSRRLQKWYLGLTAQISRASYHLNLRLRWFVVVFFLFCILKSARKGWFQLHFSFDQTFLFVKSSLQLDFTPMHHQIWWSSPFWDDGLHLIKCGSPAPQHMLWCHQTISSSKSCCKSRISPQNMLQSPSFHTKTTFWCENQVIPLRIYG